MFALTNKPEMGARLYKDLIRMSTDSARGTDLMKVIQHIAGILVETYFVFECADKSMEAGLQQLSDLLGCEPLEGPLGSDALPPAHILDFETERGRAAARVFFEEWMDCEYEFHALFLSIVHNIFAAWERDGMPRAESFRLLAECVKKCMGFEIAAQELCDVLIEHKALREDWSLGDCIAALSAVAGRRLALSLASEISPVFQPYALPGSLDCVVYVMTQEAVRLGVPAGSDWRLGLAANDVPVNAPVELVFEIEPYCRSFFDAIALSDQYDQAVACAKAAGRMLAVAAGGEVPELEPSIAKPLAMAAITETYRSVCMGQAAVGG
ncbi:MAG: hypothetical protein K9G62_06725 [Alphaproteobacteria bacterium]|nr:hypothetical protein [Alphaproteobacteria bacterium]